MKEYLRIAGFIAGVWAGVLLLSFATILVMIGFVKMIEAWGWA